MKRIVFFIVVGIVLGLWCVARALIAIYDVLKYIFNASDKIVEPC